MNRMTRRLARVESKCGAGNDRNAVSRLIGISVPHGTDTDDALADLGIVPEPRDLVLAFVGLAQSAADQRPALHTAADAAQAMAALTAAVAGGALTPSKATELARLVEGFTKALEATDFETRLAALEERLGTMR